MLMRCTLLLIAVLLAGCRVNPQLEEANPMPLASPIVEAVRSPTVPPTPETFPDSARYRPVTGADFQGAIVPEEVAGEFQIAPAYWTPSEAEVAALEAAAEDFIEEQGYDQISNWLDQYRRQYVGVEVDGRRRIYANFFCQVSGVDWKDEPVFVLDGGDCYFHFEYDPETGKFLNLQVNGES
jgi:hypothetical protein